MNATTLPAASALVLPAAAGFTAYRGVGAADRLAVVTQDGFAAFEVEAVALGDQPQAAGLTFRWAEVEFEGYDPELGTYPEQARHPVAFGPGVDQSAVLEALVALGLAPHGATLTALVDPVAYAWVEF